MQDPTTRSIGDLIPTIIGGSGAHPFLYSSPPGSGEVLVLVLHRVAVTVSSAGPRGLFGEVNVKWFSVASPGPAGNFTENAVSPLLLRALAQLGWIPNV